MGKIYNKKIVNKLNQLINNYKELSAFCEELSNDIDIVIDNISKIIKYAFIKEDFVFNSDSLDIMLMELQEMKDLDKKYQEYLNKRRILTFTRKNIKKKVFSLPLDNDIKLDDIDDLRLPTKEYLEQICRENLRIKSLEENSKKDRQNFYKEQRGFDEVGFEYTRPELITIDSSFIYCGSNLMGDVYKDYHLMYNDDRYGNKQSSPLNNDYNSNIEKIKRNSDISVRKIGNVNEIKNGRHRIIYILYNGKSVTIPAKVSRRIEDKETNIILNNLKRKYNIIIYKNNLMNDESNFLLFFNGRLYEVKNKNELIIFYNNLINDISNDFFVSIPFNIINSKNCNKIINKYREMIFNKYLNVGEKLLTINFTDAIKYFNGDANSLFYDAFCLMQYLYQSSIVYNCDFDIMYKNTIDTDIDNDLISYADNSKHIR